VPDRGRNEIVNTSPLVRWEARGREILPALDRVPRVMGIVNLTPDSFSDGGLNVHRDAAVAHARRLAALGADILDLGGESSRPGAETVALDEELRRVIPVVEILAGEMSIPISIDTTKAEVARQALNAGASIINDISALGFDPAMAAVAADQGAGVVLMHMRGTPATMQMHMQYNDVVTEVYDFLARRIDWTLDQGIPRERIAIDPGIGFAKTDKHSFEILRSLRRFESLECAILIGTSRKGFLGKITGRSVVERATASAVSSLAACLNGARVVRVHDVAPMVDTIKVWTVLQGWGASP
jgi:dihydropteroate synthase